MRGLHLSMCFHHACISPLPAFPLCMGFPSVDFPSAWVSPLRRFPLCVGFPLHWFPHGIGFPSVLVSPQRQFPLSVGFFCLSFLSALCFLLAWVSPWSGCPLSVGFLPECDSPLFPLCTFLLCSHLISAWFPVRHGFPFYMVFNNRGTDGQMDRLKDGSMEEQIEPLIERQNKFEIL